MHKKILVLSIILLLILGAAAAFGSMGWLDSITGKSNAPVQENSGTSFNNIVYAPVYKPGEYDSADTAVLISRNTGEKTVTLQNILSGRYYTLSYDGTTRIYDKYQQDMSIEQLYPGEIVYVTFLRSKKFCNTLMISQDAFSLKGVKRFSLDAGPNMLTVAGNSYNYLDDIAIFSGSIKGEMIDINPSDVLEINGIGHTVYSIRITKGHGYLRLENDAYFLGGWIELGEETISSIFEGMLMVVPEGRFETTISNNGVSVKRSVQILRGEETVIDLSDVEIEAIKTGNIVFTIEPASARVYIDGEEADISEPVEMEYGIHQMRLQADGYDTITQYIKVASETANISVALEKSTSQAQTSGESNDGAGSGVNSNDNNSLASGETTIDDSIGITSSTISSNVARTDGVTTSTVSASGTYKIHLAAPEGAEVYVDGNYIGILPVSFDKVYGSHVITLRKNGYSTRSYTIQVDSEPKDVSYSFSELEKS